MVPERNHLTPPPRSPTRFRCGTGSPPVFFGMDFKNAPICRGRRAWRVRRTQLGSLAELSLSAAPARWAYPSRTRPSDARPVGGSPSPRSRSRRRRWCAQGKCGRLRAVPHWNRPKQPLGYFRVSPWFPSGTTAPCFKVPVFFGMDFKNAPICRGRRASRVRLVRFQSGTAQPERLDRRDCPVRP